jgi:hypothetical protein
VFGWASRWARDFRDNDRSLELAQRGIERAAAADHPDAVCAANLLLGLITSGRRRDAHLLALDLSNAIENLEDPLDRLLLDRALIEDAFWSDLAATGALVERFAEAAAAVGSPSAMARAAFYRGRVLTWVQDPADLDGAATAYAKGLELARSVGDFSAEVDNLLGLAFVDLIADSPDAGSRCRQVLEILVGGRRWRHIWLLADGLSPWLVRHDRAAVAAVLLGHLQAHHPPWGEGDRHARGEVRAAVDGLDGIEALLQQGEQMSRREIVAYLLDRL